MKLRKSLWVLLAPTLMLSAAPSAKRAGFAAGPQPISCATVVDDDSAGANPVTIDYASVSVYIGRQFTASSTYSLCKVILQLSQGTSTATTVEIWSDNGSNLPLAKIGTGSVSLNLTAIGSSKTPISFTGMSASLTSGTKYWVVAKSGNGASGTFVWYDTSDGTFSQHTATSDAGVSWFSYSTLAEFDYTTYK